MLTSAYLCREIFVSNVGAIPNSLQWRHMSIANHRKRYHLFDSLFGLITHYSDVIMGAISSQITLTIVYPIVYSGADPRKHQSSASLAFVRGIHRRPVNSPHKWPVTRKKFPFDDVIMNENINARNSRWIPLTKATNEESMSLSGRHLGKGEISVGTIHICTDSFRSKLGMGGDITQMAVVTD